MPTVAQAVFELYMEHLEHEPGFWGMRLFRPPQCLIWRNRAQRDYYDQHGFHSSPTLPWAGVVKYFTPRERAKLEAAYARTWAAEQIITEHLEFGAHRVRCDFVAAYGSHEHGVIIVRTWP